MPKRLLCTAPGELKWDEIETCELGEGHLLLRAEFGSAKHGTEMSFFKGYGYPDVKFFPHIFYNSSEGREMYSKKLKYLMDCFEKIDFQSFKVKVYSKG